MAGGKPNEQDRRRNPDSPNSSIRVCLPRCAEMDTPEAVPQCPASSTRRVSGVALHQLTPDPALRSARRGRRHCWRAQRVLELDRLRSAGAADDQVRPQALMIDLLTKPTGCLRRPFPRLHSPAADVLDLNLRAHCETGRTVRPPDEPDVLCAAQSTVPRYRRIPRTLNSQSRTSTPGATRDHASPPRARTDRRPRSR